MSWKPRARALSIAATVGLVTLPAVSGAAGASAGAAARVSAAAPIDGSTTRTYLVPSDDDRNPLTPNVSIYLEVVHPTSGGEIVPAPAVLTYSPYSALGRNGDASRLVPQGFARMYADVIGTGNSNGCYDYGGLRERRTGYDVVEYVAAQPWSTGKVGMVGGSYDGTTQFAAAIEKPAHLTTIVPSVAISRWYGYAYSGGIRYTYTNEALGPQGSGGADDEGFDTPLAFDFGFSVPPPADPNDPDYAGRLASNPVLCDEVDHTTHGYDVTPDYDAFWQERDYIGGLADVDIPVLITGNWGDWNVKQEESWNAYRALVAGGNTDTHLYLGTRWRGHGSPASEPATSPAPVPPRDTYTQTVDKWLAHYLQGVDNGIQDLPQVITQTADSTGALLPYSAGPEPATTDVELFAGNTTGEGYPWTLTPAPTAAGPAASFLITNQNKEFQAASQYRSNNGFFAFESPPLARDVRIFGSPKVKLYSTVAREWVTLTPSVLDIDPSKYTGSGPATTRPTGAIGVTRGWRDSRYSDDGRAPGVDIVPGTAFDAAVTAKPTDYVFRKGHRIVLLVQTETAEWTLVKPYDQPCLDPVACNTFTVNYAEGKTSLVLPVVGGTDGPTLFEPEAEPVIPEVPVTALLPLAGGALLVAVYAGSRRRQSRGAIAG